MNQLTRTARSRLRAFLRDTRTRACAAATALFGALIGLMPQVKLLHMGLLLAGAAALGLSFGVIPAAKAAGLPPAQALRTE